MFEINCKKTLINNKAIGLYKEMFHVEQLPPEVY